MLIKDEGGLEVLAPAVRSVRRHHQSSASFKPLHLPPRVKLPVLTRTSWAVESVRFNERIYGAECSMPSFEVRRPLLSVRCGITTGLHLEGGMWEI